MIAAHATELITKITDSDRNKLMRGIDFGVKTRQKTKQKTSFLRIEIEM